MNGEHAALPSPNRLVHEPARLAILTVLSSCALADFVFLQGVTGLSKGNLSVQLTNLEQAGLVIIHKDIVDKKMRTSARLSKQGISELAEYWETMEQIRAQRTRNGPRRSSKRPVPSQGRLAPNPAG
jgi:DNA-binding transcriptional ArsR family regulator